MAGNDDKDGFGEEPQRGLEPDHSLDAYTSMHALVLRSYGYRCALTGAQFIAPATVLHSDLYVLAIKPLNQGGPLSINNCLPVINALRWPFIAGLITIEDNYRILAPQPDLLDPEMLTALRASLVVPDDVLLRPGHDYLAYHRRYALGR